MSIRQDIVTQLDTNFNLISTDNGYSFNTDGHVYEWREIPFKKDDSELPAILFRDVFDSVSDQDEQEHELTIEVGLFAVGETSPATIRAMIADILTNFKLIIQHNSVAGASYINSEMDIEHINKRYAGSVMTFSITYYTEIWGT